MIADRRLCIVGLGLMGGSLAQALRPHVPYIIGVDQHAATRQQALANGAINKAASTLSAAAPEADVLIFATPVRTILSDIRQLPALKPEGCFVLDLGSTKLAINEAMAQLPPSFAALGGHPMCGKEMAGYTASDSQLYRHKTVILTRNARTTPEVEAYVLEVLAKLGAIPMFLDALIHDQMVASVSHLPYVTAATLMRLVAEDANADLWHVSASGFRDTTRLAGSDPHMLLDILLTNRESVLEQIQGYQAALAIFSNMLEEGDAAALAAWLSAAQRAHSAYRQVKEEK